MNNMYELDIKNFQSIEEQKLGFKGFVAITGPSNLGKSSLRRAFGAVLYNDWDSSWQRNHWLKKPKPTEVTFKTPDDVEVSMTKCGYEGYNKFVLKTHIGEMNFNKVGQKCPEEIADEGFRLLNLGDEELNLQVAKQLDTLFVVAYKPTTNTKILNKVFNVSKLELASQLVVNDARKFKQELNANTKSYNEYTAKLDSLETEYSTLKEKYDRALFLFEAIEALESYESSTTELKGINSSIEDIDLNLDVSKIMLKKLESVVTINEFLTISEQSNIVTQELGSQDAWTAELEDYRDKCQGAIYIAFYLSYTDELSGMDAQIEALDVNKDFFDRFESNRNLVNYLYWNEKTAEAQKLWDTENKTVETLSVYVGSMENVALAATYCSHIQQVGEIDTKIDTLDAEILDLHSEIEKMPRCNECGQLMP